MIYISQRRISTLNRGSKAVWSSLEFDPTPTLLTNMLIPFDSIFHEAGIPDNQCQLIHGWIALMAQASFDKPNIFVNTRDTLVPDAYFLPVEQRDLDPVGSIQSVARSYPAKNFFVVNTCHNLESSTPNLKWLSWAPEWVTNPAIDYRDIVPVEQKDFSENKIWISLNHNRRVPRYLAAMYLLGADLDKTGYLRIDPSEMLEHQSWEGWIYWWHFNEHHSIQDIENFFPLLENGFHKLREKTGYVSTLFQGPLRDRAKSNFETYLKAWYRESIIEIVNETIWQPDSGGIISEKYLNSIYGKNFPILVGTKNQVHHVRNMGFDVFDDVIDHSYDTISSPTLRLINALVSNQSLLRDFHRSKDAWIRCEKRFEHNVILAKKLENEAADLLLHTLATTKHSIG